MLLYLSFAIERYEDQAPILKKQQRAMVYVTRQLWKQSDEFRYLKRRTRSMYRETFDKETRNTIGAVFPIMQIIINKEIQYEWRF